MYCPKCNTCYLDDGKFCQDCGTPLIQNAVYKEKKYFPVKTILAIAALSLSLIAGFALYKKDGESPAQGKAPDAGISGSAFSFTASNSMNRDAGARHRARHAARKATSGKATAAPPECVSPASGTAAAGAVPVAKRRSLGDKAPPEVGAPRAVNPQTKLAGGGRLPSAAVRGGAAKETDTRQAQMVVIRDPLSAENRN